MRRRLAGRVGVRLAANGDMQGWLRGNIWHEFMGKPKTEFSSASGWIPFTAELPNTWWQVGAGVSMFVQPGITIFGHANYESVLESDSHAHDVKVGLRFNW